VATLPEHLAIPLPNLLRLAANRSEGGASWRWDLASEQPLICKAKVRGGAIAHNDMIQEGSVEQLPGFYEPPRQGTILLTRIFRARGLLTFTSSVCRDGPAPDNGYGALQPRLTAAKLPACACEAGIARGGSTTRQPS
jgi:hypothetical protein